MKKHTKFTAIASAVAMLFLVGCQGGAGGQVSTSNISDQSSEMEKISYILGYDAGKNLKTMDDQIDPKIVAAAINDGFGGAPIKFTEEQAQQIFETYQKRKSEEAVKELEAKAATNLEAGKKFLEENAKKDGVQTTATGLQYKVITQGTGPKPKATDTVTVHYEGKLLDGKVFDSSYERGAPVEFPLNQVIKGWTEGVQLMPEGSKYELYIPADLAYGKEGNPAIEPNSVLIFTIELLDDAAKAKAAKDAEAQMAELMKQMQAEEGSATTAENAPAGQ